MAGMFSHCYLLTEITFSNFNNNQLIIMDKMFYECNELKKINCSDELKEVIRKKFTELNI